MTLDEMQKGLENNLFSSVDLVQTYLDRIEEVNDLVHAITELDPTALDQARILDEERGKGEIRG